MSNMIYLYDNTFKLIKDDIDWNIILSPKGDSMMKKLLLSYLCYFLFACSPDELYDSENWEL